MPKLLLIRHGENDHLQRGILYARMTGVHLNERGREQAAALARALACLSIKAIYSSPLERAVETAEPLAKTMGLEIQIRPKLMDTDVGDWQGMKIKQLRKNPLWKVVQGNPSQFRFPDGESFVELQDRVVKEIETICAAHKQNEIVTLVFHSDPIKLFVSHYLGLPLDNFQRLTVDPGSVTILVIGGKSSRLEVFNLIPPFFAKSVME